MSNGPFSGALGQRGNVTAEDRYGHRVALFRADPDQPTARGVFQRIHAEYDTAVEATLRATGHNELMEADPVIQRSIVLRNPYVDPLNYLQVEMLRRLRRLPDQEGDEAQAPPRGTGPHD